MDQEGSEPARALQDARPLVLLVDDMPEIRRTLARALASDLRVITAADGEEALELLDAYVPDVIVTDLIMPRMGGVELIRRVRERPHLEDVPILVETAVLDEEERIRLLRHGAQDYVLKPYSLEELKARVGNLVSLKRARERLGRALASNEKDLDRLTAELARRKEELEAALSLAEHASSIKTAFLSMVSHELRTPLTPLRIEADVLARSGANLTDRQRSGVARIQRATRRMGELVENLLLYTRLQAGHVAMKIAPFDLRGICAEVVESRQQDAAARGLSLALEARPGEIPLDGDRALVGIVLSLLVDNALKFTREGGVVVRLDATDPASPVFVVKDTGPGIAPADQARLFEAFEIGEPVARKHLPGAGLGLALVSELLRALGGRIEVRSTLGEGTELTVTLAAAPAAEACA